MTFNEAIQHVLAGKCARRPAWVSMNLGTAVFEHVILMRHQLTARGGHGGIVINFLPPGSEPDDNPKCPLYEPAESDLSATDWEIRTMLYIQPRPSVWCEEQRVWIADVENRPAL